jgi:FkbM family methyltransferase
MPYRLQTRWDKLACRLGLPEKTVRRDGLLFRVRRRTSDENFVHNVVESREYNPPGFEIHAGETVVDVGGNIGTFTIHAARTAGHVFTIEPNTENFRLLQCNVRLNRLENVTLINAAVAGHDGHSQLNCSGGGYHSIVEGRGGSRKEEVQAIRLGRLFDGYDIGNCFLKMDCEGAEHQIFQSLESAYFSRISRIAMEWHQVDDQSCTALVKHGFRIDSCIDHPGYRCGHLFAHR